MQTINIDLFSRCVAFSLNHKRWGILRKIKEEEANDPTPIVVPGTMSIEAKKERIKKHKLLIVAPEYDQVISFQGETKRQIEGMSVPSFFKKGIQLVGNDVVMQAEEYLEGRVSKMRELVMKLAEVYPAAIKQSEIDLGKYWDPSQYPPVNVMVTLFQCAWNWMAFGVPDSLPKQLFEAEKQKAEATWKDAEQQIILALREGFQQVVSRMTERLQYDQKGEKKVFRDSLVENMIQFISTFNNRNIVNDTQLAQLVTQAQGIMQGVKVDDLRTNSNVRDQIRQSFVEVKSTVDRMIQEMPVRSFSFDEESA